MKINNKQEYYKVMSQIEAYLHKGFSALSAKEEKDLEILSRAAEVWEMAEYPMPLQPTIADILTHIMNQKRINQSELSKALSISKASLSEILSGKKKPNIELAKELHKQFHIDGNVILESIA